MSLPPPKLRQYAVNALGTDRAATWLGDAVRTAHQIAATQHILLDPEPHPDSSRSLVWFATLNDTRIVLRIDLPGRLSTPGTTAFGDSGCGPRVLYIDATRDASIVEFVSGRSALAGDLADSERVLLALNRLHNFAVKVGRFESFAASIESAGRVAISRLTALAEPVVDHALLKADVAALTSWRGTSVLLHGDLTPGNVIIANSRAVLIDPEPRVGPPERDIATWCLRTSLGTDIDAHIATALRLNPTLDERLLRRLVAFNARTYCAYRAALGREVPPNVLSITRQVAASTNAPVA